MLSVHPLQLEITVDDSGVALYAYRGMRLAGFAFAPHDGDGADETFQRARRALSHELRAARRRSTSAAIPCASRRLFERKVTGNKHPRRRCFRVRASSAGGRRAL
jgi:hypothetical protein